MQLAPQDIFSQEFDNLKLKDTMGVWKPEMISIQDLEKNSAILCAKCIDWLFVSECIMTKTHDLMNAVIPFSRLVKEKAVHNENEPNLQFWGMLAYMWNGFTENRF